MPLEPVFLRDLAQRFPWQGAVEYGGHARCFQLMELECLQGWNPYLLQLHGIVDKAFGVRAKQCRGEQSLAAKHFKNIPVRQKEDFRAEAVGF
ncbi:hypothetical protein D3C78_853160 [compost metagenome]